MINSDTGCTGCTACVQVCPVQAIEMCTNENGFSIPQVDKAACIQCGKCERVCPSKTKSLKEEKNNAYYLIHKTENVLQQSSSGGAFYAIAQLVLAQKGVVFGCAFDAEQKRFVYANTEQVPLEDLMRSKYVECYVGNAFQEVKKLLEQGRVVAFCGTPCHVAGLRNFLDKKYDRLVLLDFTCGGVPAQSMLNDHLKRLERKYRSRVVSVNFRDKRYGWRQYCFTVKFENGKEYSRIEQLDAYLSTFLHTKVTKRESCSNCQFREKHTADFVLADFWRAKSFHDVPENEQNGISLVVCQTEKAQNMMRKLQNVEVGEITDLEAARYNFHKERMTEKQQVQLTSDRRYLQQYGLYRFYVRRFGCKHIIKYWLKQFLLKVKENGKS